jgi:glucose-6-phosphate dehydrogenase assembly protein OpcA
VNVPASRVLARADEELRMLWSIPPGKSIPQGKLEPAKSRACTMNLVVIAASPSLAAQVVPVVDEVLLHVPARAIVVGLDPDAPDELEAAVSAVCTPSVGGGQAVCSERVILTARGGLCRRLPSCVDALCATDVPMTLVWLARVHVEDPAFAPLATAATRVVLDSSQNSLSSLSQVVRWARARPESDRPGVADLAWTRLGSWQELCSRMFDPPRLRPLAAQVSRLALIQASADGAMLGPEGALLLGWLATRLGWKATSLGGKLRLVRPDGAVVQTQLRAKKVDGAPRGTLLGVEIEANGDGVRMVGDVARDNGETDAASWRIEVSDAGDTQRLEQHVRMRAGQPAPLLERTLHRPPRDASLAEALLWADELRAEELTCESK